MAAQEEFQAAYDSLTPAQQNQLHFALQQSYRTNTYDAATGHLVIGERRAQAIKLTADYYSRLFSDAPELSGTRESYAMKENTLPSAERRARLTEFFFWTSWAATTERPGSNATYTNNWPHEPLIDNRPTGENIMWSIISVVLLIAGEIPG